MTRAGLDVCLGPEAAMVGAELGLCPAGSQINLLCDCERIVKFDAQISSCTFDLRMAEQELHSPQIACALIDQGRLCPTK